MGLFSSLFQKEKEPAKTTTQTDIEPGTKREPTGSTSGNLTNGMRIDVTLKDGDYLLTGRVLELTQTTATLGRLPGELSFKTCPLNAEVRLSGYDKRLVPIFLNAVVEESNRTVFKVKDMKAEVHDETRENFRLPPTAPAFLYRKDDDHYRHPEDCQLVNISTGGCCVESEYVHSEDEVVRIRIKLEEYSPFNHIGQIVRCTERNGKFQYGILFAQLTEQEITSLNRMLFNLQMGMRQTLMKAEEGHWEGDPAVLEAERKR